MENMPNNQSKQIAKEQISLNPSNQPTIYSEKQLRNRSVKSWWVKMGEIEKE